MLGLGSLRETCPSQPVPKKINKTVDTLLLQGIEIDHTVCTYGDFKSLSTSVSISADSTSMLISAITLIISTTRPGLSAVSMTSRLEKTGNQRGLCKLLYQVRFNCDLVVSLFYYIVIKYLLFGPSSFTCM